MPLIALVVIGYVSYEFVQVTINKGSWVSHTNTVLEKLEHLLSILIDAESGVRGYLISDNATFLEPYNNALAEYPKQFQDLKTLTSDNPIQQKNLEKLQPLIKKRLALLQQRILLKNQGLPIANASSTVGKAVMDNIKLVITDMKNEEDSLLSERLAAYNESTQETASVILYGAIITATITGVIIFLIIRNVKRRNLMITEELEKKIQDRTMALEKANKELIQTDKEKGEFAAMVSHDLRNPVMVIRNYAKILLDPSAYGQLNEKQLKSIETISRSVDKLETLTSDILDAHKLSMKKLKLQKEKMDIAILINQNVDELEPLTIKKEISLKPEIKVKGTIFCDPKRISQVIHNLVKNSMDFVPEKEGKIIIRVEKGEGSSVIFTVEDNGKGIPLEHVDNLFKKFYQIDTIASREFGGTGLGLSICMGIVEAHGGKIWLDASDSSGTSFKFMLPESELGQNTSKE